MKRGLQNPPNPMPMLRGRWALGDRETEAEDRKIEPEPEPDHPRAVFDVVDHAHVHENEARVYAARMTETELVELLRAALPSSSGDVRIACVDARREPATGLVATLRLSIYDEHGVRDIKEQYVTVVRRDNVDDARIPLYVAAWGACLSRAFAHGGRGAFEVLMPADLAFPRVLELKKATTQADFEKAIDAKSRLGKWNR